MCSVGHTPEAGHFVDTGVESVWTQPWRTVGAMERSPAAMMQGGGVRKGLLEEGILRLKKWYVLVTRVERSKQRGLIFRYFNWNDFGISFSRDLR